MHPTRQRATGRKQLSFRRALTALLLFGISFGYVEAAIVVYLRAIYEPMRLEFVADAQPGELFPLLRFDQVEAAGPEHVRRLFGELGRELATLIMLAAVGLAVGRNFHQWFAAFVVAFGVWDVFYYVFLKVLIDWPTSPFTWDILFLLPVPWAGPVIAPVLVAVSMIAAGVIVLRLESQGRPVRLGLASWTAVVLGGLMIVAACCWDYRNISAGGAPNPFNWPLLLAGEIIGIGGFARGLRTSRRQAVRPAGLRAGG
ncbi:MAG TPA: hypothetical protein VM243_06690 [Phycisphaerae bacterium]|nr:hypothetical protein [Phycisphaerae bacterium]